MIEVILISSYLLFSSTIYGYYITRRAFWIMRLVEPINRIKISIVFGLPVILITIILLILFSPLYAFSILCFLLFSVSFYLETHPKFLMRFLLKYINIKEMLQEEKKESEKALLIRQKLMRSLEFNKELYDKIVEEIRMVREMVKAMEQNEKLQQAEEQDQVVKKTLPEKQLQKPLIIEQKINNEQVVRQESSVSSTASNLQENLNLDLKEIDNEVSKRLSLLTKKKKEQ